MPAHSAPLLASARMRPLASLLALAALLAWSPDARAGNCLPKLELPKAWTACAQAADCVLAGDGCRTCGNFLPVNAAHKADAEKLDAEKRTAAKCVLTCEACAKDLVALTCEAGTCRAAPKVKPASK